MPIDNVSNRPLNTSNVPVPQKAATPPPAADPSVPKDTLEPHQGIFERFEKPFVNGRDGFVALDPSGNVTAGRAPGAIVRTVDSHRVEATPLHQLLGRPFSSVLDFADSQLQSVSGSNVQLTLPETQAALGHIDPQKGGLVHIPVTANPGGTADASVLALPANYSGPILISDIDDTLRWTKDTKLVRDHVQPPIDGIKPILDKASDMGVPIIYLSAGSSRLHEDNKAFLKQLPDGVLLDRDHIGLKDLLPFNSVQTSQQGNYKEGVIRQLEQTYPDAQFFGLGDDKVGDDIAYHSTGVQPYIHNVRKTPEHIEGTPAAITDNYTPQFANLLLGNLSDAIKRSSTPPPPTAS